MINVKSMTYEEREALLKELQNQKAETDGKFSGFAANDISAVTNADDFSSENLYRAMYKNKDNVNVLKYKLKEKAKELGKTDLAKLFESEAARMKKVIEKEQREAQLSASDTEGKHTTDFKFLPDACTGNKLVGKEWLTGENGEVFMLEEKGDTIKKVIACSQPVLVNRILKDIRGCDEDSGKVEICYKTAADGWKTSIVPREMILNASKAIKLADYGINISSDDTKNFCKYMKSMLVESEREPGILPILGSTGKLGFCDKNFEKFLPYDAGDDIVFTGETAIAGIMQALKATGDRDTWFETYKKMRKENQTYFQFATAAILAAPLLTMVNSTDGFVCNIFGKSGTGKSLATCIAATIFGSYDARDGFVVSPQMTVAGMESTLDSLNNLPMVIDDFNNQSDMDKKTFPVKIMKMANGVGKTRSNISLGRRQMLSWLTTVLIGSEQSITMGATTDGARNRVLSCSTEESCVWSQGERVGELMDIFKDNYGWAGREYIEKLKEIGAPEVKRIYSENLAKIRKAGTAAKKSERQFQCLAVLMTADYLGAKYLFEDEIVMSLETALTFIDSAEENDQYKKFYDYLLDITLANPAKFDGLTYDADHSPIFWGVYKEDKIADPHGICIMFMHEQLKQLAKDKDVDTKMFFKYLEKNDLYEHDAGRNTKKVRLGALNNKGANVIKIFYPSTVEEIEVKHEELEEVIEEIPFL